VLDINGKIIFEQSIDIDPANPFMKEISIPNNIKESHVKITLFTSDSRELISYQPVEKKPMPFPEVTKPPKSPKEIGSIEELYQRGCALHNFSASFEPYPYYEEALKRDSGDYRVNTALGLLYLRRGIFDRAEKYLQTAVNRITQNHTKPRDGEAYYYLGICQRFLGKEKEAYKNLYQATWSYAFHAAAYFQLAQIDCSRGKYDLALEHLDRSLATNANNTKARNFRSALLRKLDNPLLALEASNEMMDFDRLDFGSRYEYYLAAKSLKKNEESEKVLFELKNKMRGYTESCLELSLDYANAGMFDEAIDVLTNPGLTGEPVRYNSPMINYYLGYFWAKKGDTTISLDYFNRASKLSSDYCFPFRLEEIALLETAIQLNPSDAKAPYYLGNLLYEPQPERAIRLWERSRSLDNSFALLHRNLGLAYYKTYNDIPKAIAIREGYITK
jgi:tetratricopeptide (TPR) repeat protein